ncbi:MAG: HAMP domain-containing histidine kinase [Alistipes sp.]|nr:HAMP domain-containing histidine kinase [Alistipes sp.]
MKSKIGKYLRFVYIPLICAGVIFIAFSVIDEISLGFIADWIDSKFSHEVTSFMDDGTVFITRSYDWDLVKTFLLELLIAIAAVVSLICTAASGYRKQRQKREYFHNIAGYMNRYILEDEPLPAEFSQEYTEIFAQLSKIKYEVQNKEQTLRSETQRKNDLITYLAHDLKTPLTSVIGYMTLLRDEPDLSDELRGRYTAISLKKAERIEELLNELLEITRFNISKIELQMERVDLSMMLEQIVYEFEPLLKEKSLKITLNAEPLVFISCDIDKTERVIDNLIRNAISYSYPDTEIKIALNSGADFVIMTFTNRGRTIPHEKLERIFEQFFRLDSSRSSSTGGSGLGLAIAKQLIEAHGGIISANSENEQICFTVKLPFSRKKIV